jgi:PAS domain S-box-containing protein
LRIAAPVNLPISYDPALACLSILIAILASYTALDLGGRIRIATGWASLAWIAAASAAMGGGIWSMHFVAMLAFQMAMPVAYDVTLTLLSLALAIAVTAAGFAIVGRKGARPKDAALSGMFMGLGIVGMHYTGMAAMRMPANLHYDRLLVALSVLIAVVAATVALWLVGRQQSLSRMLLAAVAMGLAIAGMHYTGMAAATFTAAAGVDHADGYATLEKVHLALAIGGTTVLLLCLALTASFYDRRVAQVVEHEAASVRRADQRLRILFQGVTDYAIYLLDPMGHVASWNAGAQHIKGYTTDEIVGRHFSCFYAQEDIDAGEPGLALETALRDGRYEKEGWRLKKDGSRFWANAILDCIRDEDGALIGFAQVTRDMTDRRKAQWVLDEAREQLFQAQKMEAIGQLTGGVAHDFNNLLTVTLGNLEMARQSLQSGNPGSALSNIDRAEGSSLRAAALTERLLAFARQQTLQPQPIDPNHLVANMSGMVRPAVGKNVAVETVLAGGLWRINVDPNRLESALLNLVINARDAMREGGKLTIETANAHLDEVYAAKHDEVIAGQYALIAVTDTGTGMTQEVSARVFEPFYTTKEIGQGSGLGLSQVFGFVKQSGGHMKIYSEIGRGTSVKIYLPRYFGKVSPQPERSDAPEALPRAQQEETVLIVEDEAEVRAYSSEVLTQLGYRVIEAEDAHSGLAALEANPAVMLLFTDVGLPGMNGRDLAIEALRRRPDLRVLYTTGHTKNAIIHNSSLDRGVHLLTKPFSMVALATKVREMVATVD